MAFFPNLSALTDMNYDEAEEVMRRVPQKMFRLTINCTIGLTREETRESRGPVGAGDRIYRPYITVRTSYNHEELAKALHDGWFDDGYINSALDVIDNACDMVTQDTAIRVKAILEQFLVTPAVQQAYRSGIQVRDVDPTPGKQELSPFLFNPSPIYRGQEHIFGIDMFIDHDISNLYVSPALRLHTATGAQLAQTSPGSALQQGLYEIRGVFPDAMKDLYARALRANINPPVMALHQPGRGATPQGPWKLLTQNKHWFENLNDQEPDLAEDWKERWEEVHFFSTDLNAQNRVLLRHLLEKAEPEPVPEEEEEPPHKAPYSPSPYMSY